MKKADAPSLIQKSILVNGVERIYLQSDTPHPKYAVIVFHGNGGTAEGFAKKYGIEKTLDNALVIYLQGIPGIGGGFDPKGLKNGWQRKKGDGDDRDLYALDALVHKISIEFPFLENKIYAMGHSNGGRLTYLLWNQRPDLFAGFIVNAHQGVDLLEQTVIPKNAFIITGKQDRVVNNANQMKSVDIIKSTLNLHEKNLINDELTIYSDKAKSLNLGHYIHPGGHDLPKTALKFLKEYLDTLNK